ncbi:Protein-methionine sulfoxide oxidase MICAL2 [Strongyloides ratti]|uniref:Protein-methionine sulfoxide oxidase MICAL2 n=1 Tax=Strongyloides ratti TaxID=34506 RepID=A0A090LN45_STRRB|nr:Protein-methionine sulfoxide oxidase MICAL2 [Strongyloides ratti]CEF71156.1 Protein-methionine sulfoxide oxidase MICAL2 [Strongyloides ratti]
MANKCKDPRKESGFLKEFNNIKDSNLSCRIWKFVDTLRQIKLKKDYNQRPLKNKRILIVGAGPCGLRMAIETRLLGGHTILMEERNEFTRNNIVHLWDFVVSDLKKLGAKYIYPKFCNGEINHIAIRRLQIILIKVCLMLGVDFYDSVWFRDIVEPKPNIIRNHIMGYSALVFPEDHPIGGYEYDFIIGADGKRGALKDFTYTSNRLPLAIGITANFINFKTPSEEGVRQVGGIGRQYKRQYFEELETETGCSLENCIYYKDETHYFIMTATKKSLLNKRVLISDYEDRNSLLKSDNINRSELELFVITVANFITMGEIPLLQLVELPNKKKDCAIFDFSTHTSAVSSTLLYERDNFTMASIVIGDCLNEPFWPTGSGIGRGFMSCLDTAYFMKELTIGEKNILDIIKEKELLTHTLFRATPSDIKGQYLNYGLNPTTRYKQILDSEMMKEGKIKMTQILFETANVTKMSNFFNNRKSTSQYHKHYLRYSMVERLIKHILFGKNNIKSTIGIRKSIDLSMLYQLLKIVFPNDKRLFCESTISIKEIIFDVIEDKLNILPPQQPLKYGQLISYVGQIINLFLQNSPEYFLSYLDNIINTNTIKL